MAKRKPPMDREERAENVLRPSHFLGYNRDGFGCYFMECGAFTPAETLFRRAVWLNPYEPLFRVHWAVSLLQLGRQDEARRILADLLKEDPKNTLAREVWNNHWPNEPVEVASTQPPAQPT